MIRLAKSSLSNAEKQAVLKVLDSALLGMGAQVREFENDLKNYLGGDVLVCCVTTGTAALHLSLQALGVGPGDEVLVPSLTYVATFQAVSATGATAVACDVHRDSGLLDLTDAQKRITSKTKAVIPVHYAGEVGNLHAVYDFAGAHGLRVVEDAAHAFGSSFGGKKVGATGDVVCFSFDGIKNITAGEGGAIVTRNQEVYAKVSDARLLSVAGDSQNRYRGERTWDFDVVEQGWRYHMSEIMAAIGRVQLSRLESEFRPIRQRLLAHYRMRLEKVAGIELFSSHPEALAFMFPVKVLHGKRDRLRDILTEAQIQVGIHYKPNHLLTKYRNASVSLPVVEALYPELLTLPLHYELSLSDIDRICDVVEKAV